MRAVVYDPQAPANLRLTEVQEPVAAESEALIDVRATALNFGEVHWIDRMRKPGEVPGWDAAGVVIQPAADGSGPEVGSRVVGFDGAGGWAQQRAVPTENLAVLPDSVDFGQAAALPVAGVTALQALRALGPVVGKRVLVTGASGGVGRFAVQLAARAGAHVTGVSRNEERARGLRELGASEGVFDVADGGEPQAVPEGVGGASLAAAMGAVAPRGTIVSYASSDPAPSDFSAGAFFRRAPGAILRGLFVFEEIERTGTGGADLARLAALVARGELQTPIDLEASWREPGPALTALLERRVAGKAVLHVD